MNAIDLLIQDHKLVKKLLEELSSTTERAVKKRADLLHRIEQELQVHTALEEDILYPAIKQAGGKEEAKMYYEAKEEHRTVDALVLPDLLNTDTGTLEFAGRVKVMKELLEHHIEEEEEALFPTAKKLLGKDQLDELGAAMEAQKKNCSRVSSGLHEEKAPRQIGRDRRKAQGGADATSCRPLTAVCTPLKLYRRVPSPDTYQSRNGSRQ